MNTKINMQEIKEWIYRNARNLELSLWKYKFEGGKKEDVIDALMYYQNEDGGFGHALEADNWNPNSTPITTDHALKIMREIGFFDMQHPIYQGIWKYLLSKKDMEEYGWKFSIKSNDDYPSAPWWNYSVEQNEKEYYGVTAEFVAFILKYGKQKTEIYQLANSLAKKLMEEFVKENEYGDMGLESFVFLVEVLEEKKDAAYNYENLYHLLSDRIKQSIEHDTDKWDSYSVRPSIYIKNQSCRFYADNADIIGKELDYLVRTKPDRDVWGITWEWFGQLEEYGSQFAISKNWWKAYRAIGHVSFLKEFGRINEYVD